MIEGAQQTLWALRLRDPSPCPVDASKIAVAALNAFIKDLRDDWGLVDIPDLEMDERVIPDV